MLVAKCQMLDVRKWTIENRCFGVQLFDYFVNFSLDLMRTWITANCILKTNSQFLTSGPWLCD